MIRFDRYENPYKTLYQGIRLKRLDKNNFVFISGSREDFLKPQKVPRFIWNNNSKVDEEGIRYLHVLEMYLYQSESDARKRLDLDRK